MNIHAFKVNTMNMTEGEHVLNVMIGFAPVRIGCKYSAALVYQQCDFVGGGRAYMYAGGRAYMYACIRICMCMWVRGCVSVAHTAQRARIYTHTCKARVHVCERLRTYLPRNSHELISHRLLSIKCVLSLTVTC